MTDDSRPADKVEELALACLERLADEGDAVIERVCSEHPELLDRVRGLLRQLRSVGLVAPDRGERLEQFGDFRLLRKLGEGGMGVVWLAEQQSLHRVVALKMLRFGLQMHARLRERFRREVQALSKLDHPNICTVYEAGEVDGTPYLAMRYVEGESLLQLLEQRRRDRLAAGATTRATPTRELLELVHLVEKVAGALHTAHAAGVVHRDVKPGNILIDRSGEPMLVDFGLAHDDDPALSVLTVTGEPLGTPAYMASEQVSGSGPTDPRTDVYALGAVLFECATLQTPFTGSSRDSLYRSILHDPVPDPRKSNRAVGRELRAVIEKALAKEPRQRFATARELAEELGRIRRHEPVRTRPVGPLLRTVRWCQRNRAATVVLAVVNVALLLSVWQLQLRIAAEIDLRAQALVAAAAQVAPENPELAFKLQREALMLQDHPEDVDPIVIAAVQQTMFRLRSWRLVREADGWLDWVQFSPDSEGRFFVVSGAGLSPTLHRGNDGELIHEFRHVVPWQRPAIAFSPNGEVLAIGDDQGLVHLYDLNGDLDGPERRLEPRSKTDVMSVAWSPDGLRLVMAHKDGSASVWTRQGEHQGDLLPVAESIAEDGDPWRAADFLPDGRVVAAGAIWSTDLDDPRPLEHECGVVTDVNRLACTATRLLTFRKERTGARLWDHEGGVLYTSPLTGHQENVVISGSFDAPGERFALSIGFGRLEIRSAVDGALLDVLRGERSMSITDFAWSRDGGQLALASFHGSIHVWRVRHRRPFELAGHLGLAFCVDFTPQGDHLVSAGWDGTARMWSAGESCLGVAQVHTDGMSDVARCRDGVLVATGRGELLLCDPNGAVLRRGEVDPDAFSVGVAPGGTKAVIASLQGRIWTWDLDRPDPPRLELAADDLFSDCDFLADGRIVVRSLDRARACILDDGQLSALPSPAMAHVAVSDDGTMVLLGGYGEWLLLRLQEGILVPTSVHGEVAPRQSVFGAAFSPDGSQALLGSADGSVTCWDLATGERLNRYDDHRGPATKAGFSPDGRRIATASFDGTVRVHALDQPDAALVLSTSGRDGFTKALWLDDQRVVTASMGGVHWWWVNTPALREAVQQVPIDPLTEREEEKYRRLLGR